MSEGQAERTGFVQGISAQFTTRAWVLIPVGVGINVAVGSVVQLLKLPLFIDTVGTILVAIMCGPWVGALTGALTNVIMTAVNPVWIFYVPLQAVIGLVAGVLADRGMARTWLRRVLFGLIIMVVAVAIGTPTTIWSTGGATGTGESAIVAVIVASGQELWTSVVAGKFIVEPVDKIVSVVLAVLIIQALPRRFRTARAVKAVRG